MRTPLAAVVALTAALVLLEAVLPLDAHVSPGTFAGFSVLGCLALVAGAKWLGKHGLQEPEPPDE